MSYGEPLLVRAVRYDAPDLSLASLPCRPVRNPRHPYARCFADGSAPVSTPRGRGRGEGYPRPYTLHEFAAFPAGREIPSCKASPHAERGPLLLHGRQPVPSPSVDPLRAGLLFASCLEPPA